MSIGEEQTECPLCMEPLEMDDINFFPCTCGYQICRFCWHRIRTDENGLCPACRKQYPEDPAEFKPLTEDELQRIKKERRQKDLQRKQKAAENRKHLANVRVVQKNLVFVVGLSQRLADTEVLKKAEYFGKFGKIHKVVINHSTSYAGAQVREGPSASAYVTYNRPEDALRAIQAVNNIYVDGRTLKASLGTTKYCSHFLRGAQCPKPDCMYLHELGEDAASFTKEEMQQGKHQEYEQKLYEMFMNSQNLSNHPSAPLTPPVTTTPPPTPPAVVGPTPILTTTNTNTSKSTSRKKASSPQNIPQSVGILGHHPVNNSKEGWPSLGGTSNGSPLSRPERLTNGNRSTPPGSSSSSTHSPPLSDSTPPPPGVSTFKQDTQNAQNRAPGHNRSKSNTDSEQLNNSKSKGKGCIQNQRQQQQQHQPQQQTSLHNSHHNTSQQIVPPPHLPAAQLATQAPPGVGVSSHTIQTHATPPPGLPPFITQPPPQIPVSSVNAPATRKSPFDIPNSMSLFSDIGFSGIRNPKPSVSPHLEETLPAAEIPDTIPVSSSTDWQAAFGFTSTPYNSSIVDHIPQSLNNDDDLGFDPWDESTKALADLIEKEGGMNFMGNHRFSHPHVQNHSNVHLPQHMMDNQPKNLPPGFSPNHLGAYNGNLPQMGFTGSKMLGLMQFPAVVHNVHTQNAFHDVLTDVALSHQAENTQPQHHPQQQQQQQQPQQVQSSQNDVFNMKDWQDGLRALLPNINISFGAPPGANPTSSSSSSSSSSTHNTSAPHSATKNMSLSEDTPHWMASLQHLTDDSTNHRLPFLQQLPFTGTPAWAAQTAQHPPPGFHAATNTLHHTLPTQDNTQSQQPLAAAAGEGLQ